MERMSRLPGRSIRNFGWALQRHQLWLAEDYLLSREIAGTHEEARRYYYKDIQAIVAGPTSSWVVCNWLTGLLLGFLAACGIAALVNGSEGALIFAMLAAVIPMAILSGNLILGPSCKTTLYTAAGEARLYSLGRQRSMDKAMERLLPFVEAAQRATATEAQASQTPATPSAPASRAAGEGEAPFGGPAAGSNPVQPPAGGEPTPPPGPDPSGP